MFSIVALENWFTDQCGAGKPCARFYAIDDESKNVIADLKKDTSGIVLVLFQPQIKTQGPDIDTLSDLYQSMIFVLQYGNDKNNDRFSARQTERRATFNALMKVRKNMIDIAGGQQCHFWKFLRSNSLDINRIGPVFEGFWGWSMDFDFTINLDTYESF